PLKPSFLAILTIRASDTPVSAATHLSNVSSPVARRCTRVNSVQASKTVKLDKCARSRAARIGAGGAACFSIPERHEGQSWSTLSSRPGTGSARCGDSDNAVLLILGFPNKLARLFTTFQLSYNP